MNIDHDALLAAFREEGCDLLKEMETALLSIESCAGSPDELEQLLLRHMHTLKGNAASVGFETLTTYAHRFEDVLETARSHRTFTAAGVVSALLQVIDHLTEAIRGLGDQMPEGSDEALAGAEFLANSASAIGGPHLAQQRAAGHDGGTHSLRVATQKLDQLINLSGELAIARGRVMRCAASQKFASPALAEAVSDLARLDEEMQDLAMRIRMVPIAPELQRFARMVRDLAIGRGKLVRLSIEAGDVEIDGAMVAALRDPLAHILRNAVDHGIETPDVREALGKARVGSIVLRARHASGAVVIEIEDDGAGIDRSSIISRAVEMRAMPNPETAPDEAIFELIFHPGFTTSAEVSEVSGRGLGMDVARRAVQAMRGTIRVESTPGNGTLFTLRLPLTLAIIDGFGVSVGKQTFVIPLDAIVECVEVPAGNDASRGEDILTIRGEALPFLRLRSHLHVESAPPERENVVVISDAGRKVGLASDRLVGKLKIVIKPLGHLFRNSRAVTAAAVLEDGEVAFVLDVRHLIESANTSRSLVA